MATIKKRRSIHTPQALLRPARPQGRSAIEVKLRQQVAALSAEVASLKSIRDDYQEVIQHGLEMIFKVDDSGHFTFKSAQFGRALGYHNNEIIGKHFTTILHPDDIDTCLQAFHELMIFGKPVQNFKFQVRNVSGDYRWIHCSAVCLYDEAGNPTSCIGFSHDISDLVRSQELLALENLRYAMATKAVAQAVVDAQEQERADIGYELHDNVGQILSTARLYLDIAKTNEEGRLDLMARSAESIGHAVSEIRRMSRSLVPGSITDLGLVASIEDLLQNLKMSGSIDVAFQYSGDIEETVTDKRKLMLFRIVQEQVNNVIRHANAGMLTVELVADAEYVSLLIQDDGRGFDQEKIKTKKGIGLHNIANRAELFNGTVQMVTEPGRGCKLKVRIPLEK